MAHLVRNPPANAGDAGEVGSDPGVGRSLGGGNGNPFQYSCLENSMARGTWWAIVPGGAKSWTGLSEWWHWGIIDPQKWHIFNVYNSMSLGSCLHWWNHAYIPGNKYVHHLPKFPCVPFWVCLFLFCLGVKRIDMRFTPHNRFLRAQCNIANDGQIFLEQESNR